MVNIKGLCSLCNSTSKGNKISLKNTVFGLLYQLHSGCALHNSKGAIQVDYKGTQGSCNSKALVSATYSNGTRQLSEPQRKAFYYYIMLFLSFTDLIWRRNLLLQIAVLGFWAQGSTALEENHFLPCWTNIFADTRTEECIQGTLFLLDREDPFYFHQWIRSRDF